MTATAITSPEHDGMEASAITFILSAVLPFLYFKRKGWL
jgi:hypothetical protein